VAIIFWLEWFMKDFRRSAHYLFLGLTSLVFFGFQSSAHAIDIHPTLTVVNLKANHSKNKVEHQLYLRVSEYDSNGITRTFTVPHLKLNWPNHPINHVDNLQIWGGALSDNQATSLVVSIMEHNAPPWKTDNLIGVLNLKLRNEQGKLLTQWAIPNVNLRIKDNSFASNLKQQILFASEDSAYTIDFVLLTDQNHQLPPKIPRALSPFNSKKQ
jgi:hypothetical protein